MEGAVRVFAGEYNGSTLSVQDNESGSPAWVITPGGAWCRLMFLSGAITEVTESGDMVYTRMSDPTGVFDLVIGGRNTDLAKTFREIPVPSFVTVSGRAQIYTKNGIHHLSVRPDHLRIVNREVRDQWVLATAKSTLERLNRVNLILMGLCNDTNLQSAIRHYSITGILLRDLAAMVEGAVQTVQSRSRDATVLPDIRTLVMDLMSAGNGPRGISVEEIVRHVMENGSSKEEALAVIESLITEDECYQPQKGFIKLL